MVHDAARVTGDRTRLAHFTIPAATGILAWFLWGVVEPFSLLLPLVFLNALAIRGLLLGRAFLKVRDDPSFGALYARKFGAGIILYGAGFGALGVFCFPAGDLVHQLPVVLLVVGMAAGALTTQVAYPRAMHAFHALSLGPLAIRLLFEGTGTATAMAGMLAVFAVGLSIVGRGGARSFRDLSRLKLQKSRLADELAAARDELAASNQILDNRVGDVTEQLAQANQLASLGRLAAGVAHEINNPLTWIVANAEYLRKGLDDAVALAETKQALGEAIDDIMVGGARISAIVKDMSALVMDDGDASDVDLNALIPRCIKVTRKSVRFDVPLEAELVDGLPAVSGNAARLSQVILNLLLNAAESIPASGPGSIRVRTWHEAREVRVEVRDTGRGIAIEPIARIFEPFYTTKPAGTGSGLGLSICRNIIEHHGGTITASSDSSGTTMTIALPAVYVAPSATTSVAASS